LDQEGVRLKGKYCNNRWCNGCNRLRTAKLINGYSPALQKLYDPYFVTLTIPSVPHDKLGESMELMHKRFYQLRDRMRKQGFPVIGLRKMECTYNPAKGYHPHYHLIVSGEHIAKQIVNDWLTYYWKGTSPKGQDYKKADENSIKEMFKYFTKMITKSDDGEHSFSVEPLDKIFIAMKGKRVFQPMGIKRVSEDIEKEQSVQYDGITPNYKTWQYDDKKADYVDKFGLTLSGYVPSETTKKLRNVCTEIDHQALTDEFKAVHRFDMREYWKERSDLWTKRANRRDSLEKIMNEICEKYNLN